MKVAEGPWASNTAQLSDWSEAARRLGRALPMTQHEAECTNGVGSALRYPETKVASCSMSCRLPQIDLIAQGADASRELMCDGFAVALASAEIGGPQVGMLGAVTQHVIDRGEDGGRHGNDRLLVADARLEAPILGTVVAGALARR